MNLIKAETKFGDVWISADVHHQTDLSVIREIIDEDCYRVQKLHEEGFKPEVIFDVGCNHGIFSLVCGKLWPDAEIFAFEPQLSYLRHAMHNLPNSCAPVCLPIIGQPLNPSKELHEDQQRWCDRRHLDAQVLEHLCREKVTLLKLDCEGAETNIIRELHEYPAMPSMLHRFDVIAGEWHLQLARDFIRDILPKTHKLEINMEGDVNLFFARRK